MNASTSEVLDVAEHLDGLPNVIEAFGLGGENHEDHLDGGQQEGEHYQVEDVDQNDVEEPAHHIVMRVENVQQ